MIGRILSIFDDLRRAYVYLALPPPTHATRNEKSIAGALILSAAFLTGLSRAVFADLDVPWFGLLCLVSAAVLLIFAVLVSWILDPFGTDLSASAGLSGMFAIVALGIVAALRILDVFVRASITTNALRFLTVIIGVGAATGIVAKRSSWRGLGGQQPLARKLGALALLVVGTFAYAVAIA